MHEQLRTAPLVVIELDEAHGVVTWNDRAERLFATSRDAAVGRPIADLLPLAGSSASWPTALARDDDEPARVVVAHPTAGERHLDVWAQRGAGVAFRVFAHDVTARVPRERRCALDALLVSTITSNLDLVLWAIDREGKFLVHQGKALAAAGIKEHQFVGLNMYELYGDNVNSPIRHAAAGTSHHSPPMEEHGVFWENWYLAVDDPASGAAAVGVSLDVSEAHRRQEELRNRIDLIEQQREVIRELSTPIIEVWDGVLTLPIVGLVDSVRTAELMDNLLQTITRLRSRFAILDLTGVQVVDTSTASHLIGLIQAIRLLGAEGILTGIHPNIAQTVVAIGVDLAHVRVFATLRDALKFCIRQQQR